MSDFIFGGLIIPNTSHRNLIDELGQLEGQNVHVPATFSNLGR